MEAYNGGAIGAIEDGDIIEIDINRRWGHYRNRHSKEGFECQIKRWRDQRKVEEC
jgi:dihydroxyacid dehydratase/phosphogluconate dehydratase